MTESYHKVELSVSASNSPDVPTLVRNHACYDESSVMVNGSTAAAFDVWRGAGAGAPPWNERPCRMYSPLPARYTRVLVAGTEDARGAALVEL